MRQAKSVIGGPKRSTRPRPRCGCVRILRPCSDSARLDKGVPVPVDGASEGFDHASTWDLLVTSHQVEDGRLGRQLCHRKRSPANDIGISNCNARCTTERTMTQIEET